MTSRKCDSTLQYGLILLASSWPDTCTDKMAKCGSINGFHFFLIVTSNSEVTGAFSLQNKAKQQFAI